MNSALPLFPQQASTMARHVDAIYMFMAAICGITTLGIAVAIIYLAVKYRRGAKVDRTQSKHPPIWPEVVWIGIPFMLMMVFFFWGASVFFRLYRIPERASEIVVVGKQWMWKIQHPQGQKEINELHVPTGQPIRLTMISEDVIHDFFIPVFRVKHDVLPGRYQAMWFEADTPGEYHLFCAQFCGSKHSEMVGRVVVMTPADFSAWLRDHAPPETIQQAGRRLYLGHEAALAASGTSAEKPIKDDTKSETHRCDSCHGLQGEGTARGPALRGLYGRRVPLESSAAVLADEDYLRESILRPNAKIVAGYKADAMPTFEGVLSEEEVLQLIAYIRSLSTPGSP